MIRKILISLGLFIPTVLGIFHGFLTDDTLLIKTMVAFVAGCISFSFSFIFISILDHMILAIQFKYKQPYCGKCKLPMSKLKSTYQCTECHFNENII